MMRKLSVAAALVLLTTANAASLRGADNNKGECCLWVGGVWVVRALCSYPLDGLGGSELFGAAADNK
jgi:hypothetical protein